MNYYFNPLDKRCKSVTGGAERKTPVTFRVFSDASFCDLVIRKDGENDSCYCAMEREDGSFTYTLTLGDSGLYWYYFRLDKKQYIGAGEGLNAALSVNPRAYQLTIFTPFETPDWIKGGAVYQIFPDRFRRGGEIRKKEGRTFHEKWNELPVYLPDENGEVKNDDFFGGNFAGIEEKLDYLAELGVTAIYLNPIFEAFSNHRYDTGDFMKIDRTLGTEEEFKSLLAAARSRGIRVILDGVFNHTGADSRYFNKFGRYDSVGAYQSKDSPYYGWYKFIEYPGKYVSWWGFDTLPAVNEDCPGYERFIAGKDGVLEHYTRLGIGGWRLDVADELPDDFIRKIRNAVKAADPEALLVGEVWEDASNKVSYNVRRKYLQGAELDGAIGYPFRAAALKFVKKGDARAFATFVKTQIDHYPKQSLDVCFNVLGTHDTKRIITELAENTPETADKAAWAAFSLDENAYRQAKEKLKIASLLQFTVPGVPCVYYGDEAGMQGYKDPLNRLPFPWGEEDEELEEWYRFLGRLRARAPFAGGEYKELYADRRALVFERRKGSDAVVVAVNMGSNEYSLQFEGEIVELVSRRRLKGGAVIKPHSYGVYYTEEI